MFVYWVMWLKRYKCADIFVDSALYSRAVGSFSFLSFVFLRQHCQILEVIPPNSNGTVNGHVKHRIEGDSIVISDSDDEITITSPMSPKTTPSG